MIINIKCLEKCLKWSKNSLKQEKSSPFGKLNTLYKNSNRGKNPQLLKIKLMMIIVTIILRKPKIHEFEVVLLLVR